MTGTIRIRRARASDKETVLEFCRFTWQEHGDYIHKVWDDWLADRRGFFAVAALRGRPVATAKLSVLGPGEMWLEGLRVDPSLRGRGMSRALTGFLLARARKLGARTVRFATGEDNRPSKHVARTLGFRLLSHYSILWAPSDGRRRRVFTPVSDPARALALLEKPGVGKARSDAVGGKAGRGAAGKRAAGANTNGRALLEMARLVSLSPFGRAMKGLASVGWTFFQINGNLLAEHVESRQLFLGRSPVGDPPRGSDHASLGILLASRNNRAQRLDAKLFADVARSSFGPMLLGTRRLAHDLGVPRVRIVVPKAKRFLQLSREAGFKEEDPGFYHGVMEKRIGSGRAAASLEQY
jgi:GNAT superfamily N-acetyltransferase